MCALSFCNVCFIGAFSKIYISFSLRGCARRKNRVRFFQCACGEKVKKNALRKALTFLLLLLLLQRVRFGIHYLLKSKPTFLSIFDHAVHAVVVVVVAVVFARYFFGSFFFLLRQRGGEDILRRRSDLSFEDGCQSV
jgi:hypothetical protein